MRLGVALLVPSPFAAVVDAWRLGLGDPALPRIPAHLTLVPPVNVREDALGAARGVVRTAAVATRPFTATLGPPTSFMPDNPVVYLPVGGDVDAVHALRDRVFARPLERPLSWPFVPHVTVADDAPPGRIEAALVALADAEVTVTFDRVHLLQEGEGRIWTPIAEFPFGTPSVVGRGGIEIELRVTAALDTEARHVAHRDAFVITARRDGVVVGYAEGWVREPHAHLTELLVVASQRRQGVARQLLAAFESEAAARGAEVATAYAPAAAAAEALLASRGWEPAGSHPLMEKQL